MGSMLLNILFVAGGSAVGLVAGWFIRGSGAQRSVANVAAAPIPLPQPVPAEPEKSLEHVDVLMSRLHQLTAAVAADVGEHNTRVTAINDELTAGGDVASIVERLFQANEQMQNQLKANEQRMQQQAQEIESHVKEARTDALTKLANRRAFDDEIRRCIELFKSNKQPSCVMMIDVDHFKKFNDTYGHQAGDEVLRSVGRVMRREASGKEVVCRYGGEEFAVIYPGMDIKSVIPRAEKARAAIAAEIVKFQGMDLKVTASGGVAELMANETGESLVKRADVSLYVCKENGRNCGYWNDGKNSLPMKGGPAVQPVAEAPKPAKSKPAPIEPEQPVVEESVFRFGDAEENKFDRHDPLADVADKKSVLREIKTRLDECREASASACLALMSLDHHDQIVNDFGHKASELAARATAQIVRACLGELDFAARIDKNVFCILLPGVEVAEACSFAEKIRGATAKCNLPVHGETLRFTISAGVVAFRHEDSVAIMFARAEESLAASQSSGGNQTMSVSESDELLAMASM